MSDMELTAAERLALRRLRTLERDWPKTLWIYCGSGFYVMRNGPDGKPVMTGTVGGTDPKYIVDRFNIPQDGGDW